MLGCKPCHRPRGGFFIAQPAPYDKIRYVIKGEKRMKKFFLLALIFPSVSFAAPDVSDCEKMGHRISSNTIEKCMEKPEVCKEEPSSSVCYANSREKCQAIVEEENINVPQYNYIMRCPKTAERLALSANKNPTSSAGANWKDNDGNEINFDALTNDEQYVYFVRTPLGLSAAISGIGNWDSESWRMVTSADSNGLYLVPIE